MSVCLSVCECMWVSVYVCESVSVGGRFIKIYSEGSLNPRSRAENLNMESCNHHVRQRSGVFEYPSPTNPRSAQTYTPCAQRYTHSAHRDTHKHIHTVHTEIHTNIPTQRTQTYTPRAHRQRGIHAEQACEYAKVCEC